ncbi:MAG TPA: polyprenyl synthetase family protein [Bacillota bacterium]|nr:polyprenyl synthetase family protein [Bacillota bacterium]
MLSLSAAADPLLQQVDQLIKDALTTSFPHLQEMVDHLLLAGGKKIRPLLVLLSGRVSGEQRNPSQRRSLVSVAAAVELIHTASLVHDDIIDRADRRRGQATLHSRWGNRSATLVGDFLLSRAFDLISDLEQNWNLLPLMSRSVMLLCRGEVLQLEKSYDYSISEQEYFRCNYLKTSQFLAACCEAGGRIGAAAPAHIRALREYGFNLGQAFQIVDDILDFKDDPEKLGKPVGADLDQGVMTLPLIYLARRQERFRLILEALKTRRMSLSPGLRESIRRAVRESGALEYSARRADQARRAALQALQVLPQTPARTRLSHIAEAIMARAGEVF